MLLILAPGDHARWLSEEPDPSDLLRVFRAEPTRMCPISRVNKPENDDSSIVEHDRVVGGLARHRTMQFGSGSLWPHLLSGALFKHSIRLSSLYGLRRKPYAPAFNARAHAISSKHAVTKMTGISFPSAIKRCCRSTPLMPGSTKSVITQ
jgi:hypothetical protein